MIIISVFLCLFE